MTRIEVAAVIAAVERRRGLPRGEILGTNKSASVVIARQECYLRLRVAGLSYPEVGHHMRKDHSTVHAGVKRLRAIAPKLTAAIEADARGVDAIAIDIAAIRRAAELKAGVVERQGWAYAAEGRAA